jgi:hypothetical protein
MIHPWVYSRYKRLLALLLAALMLTLLAAPALASAANGAGRPGSGHQEGAAPCLTHTTTGALGHEGGALSLLGTGGQSAPTTVLATATGSALKATYNGHSATYAVYTWTGCLGQEGGLLSWHTP